MMDFYRFFRIFLENSRVLGVRRTCQIFDNRFAFSEKIVARTRILPNRPLPFAKPQAMALSTLKHIASSASSAVTVMLPKKKQQQQKNKNDANQEPEDSSQDSTVQHHEEPEEVFTQQDEGQQQEAQPSSLSCSLVVPMPKLPSGVDPQVSKALTTFWTNSQATTQVVQRHFEAKLEQFTTMTLRAIKTSQEEMENHVNRQFEVLLFLSLALYLTFYAKRLLNKSQPTKSTR